VSINNNVWELAEAYLSNTLSEEDILALKNRLASDTEFAAEFHESTNLIRSVGGSGKQKRFRTMLREIHAEQISSPAKKSNRIILPAHIWRTAAVAAGVALLTSTITYSLLNPYLKKTESQYNIIRRQVDNIKESQNQLNKSQKQLEKDLKKINTPSAPVRYTGTGFALNNDGYFVTSYHVTNGADSVYIQDHNGEYFKASVENFDENADLAVLKVEKKNFHFSNGDVPYTFAIAKSGLGERIYTLGYPKDQIVYSEGYISARNGFEENDNQYSLVLPAGHGQSGSPVIDEKGNIVGILTATGNEPEANTYAVSSKALIDLLHKKLPPNTLHLPKANKLGRMSREEQIRKMEAYTFSVKVYKK
jgi:serine protease Do